MAKRIRARGMNAALAGGEAGVGEMNPARSPLRPRQFGVALAAAVVGGSLGMFTYHAVSSTTSAYTGQVAPTQTYYLNFPADGTVLGLDVKPGQHVKKGQVLATQDSAVAQSQLSAAQAAATADAAVVAADQDPQATQSASAAAELSVSQAQAAVSAAQNALTTQQNSAQHTVTAQSAAVTSAQNAYQSDDERYATDCSSTATPAGPGAATSTQAATAAETAPPAAGPMRSAPAATGSPSAQAGTPTPKTTTSSAAGAAAEVQQEQYCANLQSAVNRDATTLSSAQAELANVQSSVQLQEARDSSDLSSSQNVLTAAQTRQSASTAPVTPAVLDQAKADLATAQAQVATDQQALRSTQILAPADGVVAAAAGAAGDVVGPDGVHGYQGPSEESGTQSNGGSGFELFVPQTGGSGGGTSSQNTYMPLITLYTAPYTVVAQVPETDMSSVRDGASASLDITALDLTVKGTVENTELDPVNSNSSTTYYDVTIGLATTDAHLMAGMSVQVTIG